MDSTAPPVMVKASILADKLRNAIGEGVDSALLLTTSGALLSTASARSDFARSQECKMLAALVANIWRTYASSAHGLPAEPNAANNNVLMMQQQMQQQQQQHQQGNWNQHQQQQWIAQQQMLQQQIQQQQQQLQSGSGGSSGASNSDLELVMAELETSKLCCFGLGGKAVLALFANSSTELGLLKLKAASLQAELYDGLRLAMRNDFGIVGGGGIRVDM